MTDIHADESSAATLADPDRRARTVRDAVAAALLVAGFVFPWNVNFGMGVPDSSGPTFAALAFVTLLALGAIAVSYVRPNIGGPAKVRIALSAPYLVFVAAFVGYAIVRAIQLGGTGTVPPGVGPGAWIGAAGALLGAQAWPADAEGNHGWMSTARIVGIASMVLATLAVAFNLYWSTRHLLGGDSEFSTERTTAIATAVVYGIVSLVIVVAGSRWTLHRDSASRLATVALGCATLAAGMLVWTLDSGREIDAYHGIAQITMTTKVGFEGYFAWVVAAAIFASVTLNHVLAQPIDLATLREAARKCLALIAVGCFGAAVLRITGAIAALMLDLKNTTYDTTALVIFDVVAGALALFIRFGLRDSRVSSMLTLGLTGILLALTISRVIVGIVLVPRIPFVSATNADNPVFGNTLSQQITSTFDVVLCWLALAVVLVTLLNSRKSAPRSPGDSDAPPAITKAEVTATAVITTAASDPLLASTTADATRPVATAAATQVLEAPTQQLVAAAPPRIFRQETDSTRQLGTAAPNTESTQKIRAAKLLAESTQRVGAGTTYSGPRHRSSDD